MISREELVRSKEYWLVKMQAALYEQVELYLQQNNMSKTEFASKLGVSKGYVSQLLNGDFDHKLSKLVELSLAIGKAPVLQWYDIEQMDAVTTATPDGPTAHTYPIAEQPAADYMYVTES